VEAPYPPQAQAADVQGSVVLKLTIDAEGNVTTGFAASGALSAGRETAPGPPRGTAPSPSVCPWALAAKPRTRQPTTIGLQREGPMAPESVVRLAPNDKGSVRTLPDAVSGSRFGRATRSGYLTGGQLKVLRTGSERLP